MYIKIFDKAQKIINALEKNGYQAFVVGGCVRDSLRLVTPHDWDICTSAAPDEIKQSLKKFRLFDSGIKHGTISAVIDGEVFEVTTFRIDGEYADNRRPLSVEFTEDITLDLARRDFTINAMAYNSTKGLIDCFGGQEDLKNKLIRCVGNPNLRFQEDALRILRALRFASALGFDIEETTAQAIHKNRDLLKNIAAERISEELNKLIVGESAERILLEYKDVFAVFIPELIFTFNFDQRNHHHNRDVYCHIAHSVGIIKPDKLLRITMLFHDIAKPLVYTEDARGERHFKGHQKKSADIAEAALRRLKYPKNFISRCVTLVEAHDIRFNGEKRLVKRTANKIGEENMPLLFEIQRADVLSQSDFRQKEKLLNIDRAERQFGEILAENSCFSMKDLAVNGNDLIAYGITDGKTIGCILNTLLESVIDEKIPNSKQELIKASLKIYNDL